MLPHPSWESTLKPRRKCAFSEAKNNKNKSVKVTSKLPHSYHQVPSRNIPPPPPSPPQHPSPAHRRTKNAPTSPLPFFFNNLYSSFPNGTMVSKSGPSTKTTIYTVYLGHLRKRNQINGNLPLASHFVCGPAGGEDHKKSPKKQTFVPLAVQLE